MVKKIDFHIHTISSEKDYDFSYSSNWLKKYVKEANLDAIAVTNHDLFDRKNFNKVVEDVPNVKVFPGMELSLEEGHVNVIFPESEIDKLEAFSEWLLEQELGQSGKISTLEFCENMPTWEKGIYIFELGKSNSLSVPKELSNVTAVGGVTSQLKFQSFYKKEGELTPTLFSDAHASDDDPEEKRRDIEILKLKNTYLQADTCDFQDIKKCISDKTKVGINENYLNDVITVDGNSVSTGLNLIVGKRGTGKTEFLKKIKESYPKDEIYEIAQFETAKADEYIEKQRKIQGNLAFKDWKDQFNYQFNAIQDYINKNDEDRSDDELEKYLESVKKFAQDTVASNSTTKYKLIKESNFEEIPIENIKKYLNELKNLISSKELWKLLKEPDSKKKIFVDVYNELKSIYVEKNKQNKLKTEVNKILDLTKEIVESKTGITPVSKCEFTKIVHKKQKEKEINKFMNEIVCERELKKENIYGYQIIVKVLPYQNASQFKSDMSINEAVNDDLIKPYKNKDYISFLKNLKEKKFFKVTNLPDYFLHLEVQLLDCDGVQASGGQAVGFALMMRLEEAKSNPIILIDEPEASLDNAYIREELIGAVKELSRNSTVFVVTHNSTLGTLINPDYLIVTSKDENKNYHVLTGEFSSTFISKSDIGKEKSYEKFVEAMEAGIETYKEKGKVYESLKN